DRPLPRRPRRRGRGGDPYQGPGAGAGGPSQPGRSSGAAKRRRPGRGGRPRSARLRLRRTALRCDRLGRWLGERIPPPAARRRAGRSPGIRPDRDPAARLRARRRSGFRALFLRRRRRALPDRGRSRGGAGPPCTCEATPASSRLRPGHLPPSQTRGNAMTLPRSARLGFLLAVLVPLVAGAEGAAERFFFGVGANDGGPTRARLRYAGKDATAMARLLRELGGVPDENVVVLLDPGREDFFSAWASLLGRMRAARARGQRVERFFYYSGHSDEAGLIWGDERLDYRELRRALREPPAEVVVAILDSCASGALTRLKGGTIRPALLVDESTRLRGHAILTSSSADEVAQESDRLRGSFFTHHLMAGLRGAADMRGAGRVTLTEAYRYAFEETLAQTERTLGGPQHPAYEIELHGSGDLV